MVFFAGCLFGPKLEHDHRKSAMAPIEWQVEAKPGAQHRFRNGLDFRVSHTFHKVLEHGKNLGVALHTQRHRSLPRSHSQLFDDQQDDPGRDHNYDSPYRRLDDLAHETESYQSLSESQAF